MKTAGSSSGRFYVTAPDSVIAVQVSRWAEDIAGRLEQAVGGRLAPNPSRLLRIVVLADDGRPGSSAGADETVQDGLLVQQLTVNDFSGADWEEGLEKLCGLLVSGNAADRFSARHGMLRPIAVPEWLSAGLAQYIDPALRSRNREFLQDWRRTGTVPAFTEVLKWVVLPPGRTRERVLSGTAVAWLCSAPDRARLYDVILGSLCVDEPVSAGKLIAIMPAYTNEAALEKGWQAWVERECSVVAKPASLSADWIDALRAQLLAVPGQGGVPADLQWDGAAEPGALTGVKKAAWIPSFCSSRIAAIRMLEVGRSPEFVAVAEQYVAFFEALGKRRRDETLSRLLAQADAASGELRRNTEARVRYMDAMERVYWGRDVRPGDVAGETNDVVERSELQRYIDEVELRMKQEEGGAETAAE